MKDSVMSFEELRVRTRKVLLSLSRKKAQEDHPRQKHPSLQSLADVDNLPIGVKFDSKRWKRILSFILIFHCYPLDPGVYTYMRIDLEELIERSQSHWLVALLQSEERFFKFLQVQTYYSEQAWFSGICSVKYLEESLDLISFIFEEKLKRPRRVVRRKGYKDKGSLGDSSTRAILQEWHKDFISTELQYQIELHRQLLKEETVLFALHLDEGRVLTDELMLKFHLRRRKDGETEIERKDSQERRKTEADPAED